MYEMKLQEKYFNLIKEEKKKYEIRLNDEKRQKIKTGDTIVFKKEPLLKEQIVVRVEKLKHFVSFEEMINCLDKEDVGFHSETRNEIISLYHQFYSLEDEKKYGVLAIKIKKQI